jgi:hypothetical protein
MPTLVFPPIEELVPVADPQMPTPDEVDAQQAMVNTLILQELGTWPVGTIVRVEYPGSAFDYVRLDEDGEIEVVPVEEVEGTPEDAEEAEEG